MKSRVTNEAYVRLCRWREEHLPWLAQPDGPPVFFRLVRSRDAVAAAALYRMLARRRLHCGSCSTSCAAGGLVTVMLDPRDRRRELVEATDRLRQLAHLYVLTMIQLLL
jgi:hypothetical protein